MRRVWLVRTIVLAALLALPFLPRITGFAFGGSELEQHEGVHVPESRWQFGTLPSGGIYRHAFVVVNHTGQPLSFLHSTSTCGCATANLPEEPIAPGKFGAIDVVVIPGDRTGPYTGSILVETDHPEFNHIKFSLEGSFVHTDGRLATSPGGLYIKSIRGAGDVSARIMLSRLGDDRLGFLAAKCDLDGVIVRQATIRESPHRDPIQYTELEVLVADGLAIGTVTGSITVMTDHDTVPSTEVPVSLSVLSPFEVYPEVLYIGNCEQELAVGSVRVRHRLGLPLKVEGVEMGKGMPGSVRYDRLDCSTIRLRYSLPQKDMAMVKSGGEILVTLEADSDAKIRVPTVTLEGGV